MGLTERDKAALLGEVMWHWDSAYEIEHDGERYLAHRIGGPEHVLMAETASELRLAIRADYTAWISERAT